jgi:hypothetical protein
MKKLFGFLLVSFFIVSLLIPAVVIAQTPKKMTFQAVIRNGSGTLVKNSNIGIRISILQTSISGTAVYIETQTSPTNDNGLLSLEIGGGTSELGAFDAINWSAGPYFIKTETDLAGGSDYTIAGTSELLYVPYAFNADMASTSLDNVWRSEGSNIYNTNSGNVAIGNVVRNASLSVARGSGLDGTAAFFGTQNVSHFNFSADENTYIRGGKDNSNVIINDISGGKIGLGMATPGRASVEQYGTVGTTAAIFGGEGPGVSLQSNWPAIGLNHYYDGSNSRAIGAGYGAQIFVDQSIGIGGGAIGFCNFPVRSPSRDGLLVSPVTRVYLQNGMIGIGTRDPQCDIDIVNDGSVTPLSGFNDPLTGTSARFDFMGQYLRYYFNGGYVAYVNDTGDWVSTSDSTLKRDILPLKGDFLSMLTKVTPVTYNMKTESEGSKLHYGFISQNIETVFPELVTLTENIKMMDYQGMIPIAIEAIREEHQVVEDLKKENQVLEERIIKLEEYVLQAQKTAQK